jgi:hypothetical protein
VIIKLPKEQSQSQPQSQSQGKKGKPKEYIALSNTQSVVVHLCKMLPKASYHVFTDNLFSSPNLFRTLRETGYGATGTVRPNCGITKQLKDAKENDKAGKGPSLQYNEVRAIPTEDCKVRLIDGFLYVFLTNSSFLGRANRLAG